MSSTNRGAQRQPDDYYRTPAWAIVALLPELCLETFTPRTILDPCAGDGAILDVVGAHGLTYGIELDSDRAIACQGTGRHCVVADALRLGSWAHPLGGGRPDRIVMNPPFSLAMEFVERALREVAPGGIVVALLRLAWLASAKRAAFHRAHPSRVLVLPRRPEFVMSCSCGAKPKCDWSEMRDVDGPRPKACGGCGGKVAISTSDSADYGWFLWGRDPGTWDLLGGAT